MSFVNVSLLEQEPVEVLQRDLVGGLIQERVLGDRVVDEDSPEFSSGCHKSKRESG